MRRLCSLRAPIWVAVRASIFAALNAPVEPMLTSWSQPVARAKATVNLRQKVKAKATGSYRKVFFVTLSTDTP